LMLSPCTRALKVSSTPACSRPRGIFPCTDICRHTCTRPTYKAKPALVEVGSGVSHIRSDLNFPPSGTKPGVSSSLDRTWVGY
jgi:hypothetical protein